MKRLFFAVVACGLVASCAAAKGQLDIANVSGCIQKQCAGSGDATDRASCEAACRRTYGQ